MLAVLKQFAAHAVGRRAVTAQQQVFHASANGGEVRLKLFERAFAVAEPMILQGTPHTVEAKSAALLRDTR